MKTHNGEMIYTKKLIDEMTEVIEQLPETALLTPRHIPTPEFIALVHDLSVRYGGDRAEQPETSGGRMARVTSLQSTLCVPHAAQAPALRAAVPLAGRSSV